MIFEFKDYQPLPTGSYPVRVTSVETKNGQFGEQVQFTLEVTSGAFAGHQLKAWCNPSGSKNGKLYRWARALLGTQKLTELDTNDLVGRQAMALVAQQQGSDGNTYNKVVEILPVPTGSDFYDLAGEDPFGED